MKAFHQSFVGQVHVLLSFKDEICIEFAKNKTPLDL
jgi:hypothetical protein